MRTRQPVPALASIALLAGTATPATAATQFLEAVFAWGAGGDRAWSGAAGNSLAAVGDDVLFARADGYSARNAYNADFASSAACAAAVPPGGALVGVRKYGCRYTASDGTPLFVAVPASDEGPLAYASGTLEVSETRITGTLAVWQVTDEPFVFTSYTTLPNGVRTSNSVGNGADGYNYRNEDPQLGNAWYGLTTSGRLEIDLTGTFIPGETRITGGTMRYTDGGFACQQGAGSSPTNVLCTPGTVAGGLQSNGAHLSWGWDPDGAGTGTAAIGVIEVRDATGAEVVATLDGVRAESRTWVDYYGYTTTVTLSGEFRRAIADASCGAIGHLRWDGTGINCGTLVAGRFGACIGDLWYCNPEMLATGVPIPAAGWLAAAAGLSLPAFMRRRARRSRS